MIKKHTPGPWKIFDGWGSSRSTPVVVDCIPDIDGKCVANCICHVAATNDDAAANARLIAAAPELLDALEALFSAACEVDLVADEHKALQDAIDVAAALLGRIEEGNKS